SRPRNASVRYSIFLGTGSTLTTAEVNRARRIVDECCIPDSFLAVIKPALEEAVSDLSDSVENGDGVVSVARGRLEGVTDTMLLRFDHWNVIRDCGAEPVAALHREILDRLPARQGVAKAQA